MKTTGKLVTRFAHLVTGVANGKPYKFVSTRVDVKNGQLHDVALDVGVWDAIATMGTPFTEFLMEGDLAVAADGYVVNVGKPNAYTRGRLNGATLVDVKESPVAAKAYERGVRLPLSGALEETHGGSSGEPAPAAEPAPAPAAEPIV